MPSRALDVAIVGGGLIGLAVSWRLAQAGAAVAVFDPAPGRGASWVAAGMLAPVTEVHFGEGPLLALNALAAGRWEAFAAELEEATGSSCGYRREGTLAVGFDAGDRAALEDLAGYQRSLGLEVEILAARECRALEPMLSPQVGGGLLVSGDRSVDNRRLVVALLAAAERAGVSIRRSAVEIRLGAGGRVAGLVSTDGDRVAAGTVVVAAGARSGSLGGLPPGALPPVRPVKGQLLRCRVPAEHQPLFRHTVRGLARGRPVYLVPRDDGELVVGATVEERGFDESVTVGACYELLRAATSLAPVLSEVELVEACAGLRPTTPDNAPLLGPSSLDGLLIATGHYRNGVLLAPVTADALAECVATGRLPAFARPFSADRFATVTP